MKKILLTDDHRIVRQGLRSILEDEFPSAQFFEAETAQQAKAIILEKQPDVVLLDISMPGQSGLELLKELAEEGRRCRVVIISMYAEKHWVEKAAEAGASGYLAKECDIEELLQAVKMVAAGGQYFGSHYDGSIEACKSMCPLVVG